MTTMTATAQTLSDLFLFVFLFYLGDPHFFLLPWTCDLNHLVKSLASVRWNALLFLHTRRLGSVGRGVSVQSMRNLIK